MALGEPRMNLDSRFRIHIEQTSDTPRLRARKVLTDDTSGGQINREIRRHWITALAPFGHIEPALSVREEGNSSFQQPRRAWMILRRTGPEHPHFAINPLVGNAIVIGDTTARSLA